jgi:hypothetical protein
MNTNIRNATSEDKAYLAGLFDGEGSVNIFKQSRSYMAYSAYFIEISIGNTHEGVLNWVLEKFGGRVAHNSDHRTAGSRKVWRWRASSNEAYEILVAMLPYLIVKKEQAQLAIEFRERQVKFSGHSSTPLTQEENERREMQKVELIAMRTTKKDE